jgi:GNAT superfamily N-acetyltransferase
MSPAFRIQPARASRALTQICQVVNAVSPEQRMTAEVLAHYLASNPGAVLLLAHAGADVAGAATAAPAGRPGFQFTMVRVVPGQRRRGVGSALLEAARVRALALGLPRLWGRVDAGVPGSIEFTRRRGLAEAGRELISAIDPTGASEMLLPHLLTCVRRPWRGRGVALAMKSAQIAWAKRAGITRLETSNDSPNTAMLAVNRRLGYRTIAENVIVEGMTDVRRPATRTA